MPRKIRELEFDLKRNGFASRPGKGSHRVYNHPRVSWDVTMSGKAGDDAKPYQEKMVKQAIKESKS